MTLPVLLAHVAARWAVTRTPAHGWVPDESETDMNERTYTLADMARAWDEGYEEACRDETHGDGDPNPYEEEKA